MGICLMAKAVGIAGLMVAGAAGSAQAADEIRQARYLCERGVVIDVSYVKAGDRGFAVVQAEGRQLALEQTESPVGTRYFGVGVGAEVSGPVWWSQDDTGTLSWFDAEHSEEVTLYHKCALQM